jgi:predicted transcriptional regulator
MEKLTIQEEAVMLYVWKLKQCFIRDILAEMPEPKPPYTSIASVVRNLEKKKYVSAERFGPITQLTPAISENDYKRTFMSDVVRDYFTGSYKEMVSFFVRDKKLSRKDLEELMKIIEEEKDK